MFGNYMISVEVPEDEMAEAIPRWLNYVSNASGNSHIKCGPELRQYCP